MPPLLSYGFRPFYILAAMLGAAMVPLTLAGIFGLVPAPDYFGPFTWHAHEMVFGYAAAIIAGFLLTATANWTGLPPTRGAGLAALTALWAAGRVAIWYGDVLPGALVAAIDIAFLPAVALAVGAKVVRARNFRNLIVVAVLLALTLSNLALHLVALGYDEAIPDRAIEFSLGVLMILLALLGGRVIPFFTGNSLPQAKVRQMGRLDMVALVLLLPALVPGLDTVAPWLFGVAALAHLARMIGWRTMATFGTPLLWILHLGYFWIVVSLALRAFGGLYPEAATAGIHALTVGAVGALTIGMMSRTALGHTGRPLHASRVTLSAFVLVNLAALFRVGGALRPDFGTEVLWASAAMWSLALLLYLAEFLPVLTSPRPDGKPG
ncbi:MAG: NnrS family protein [Rhodospirillales bacterium]|nr:NnrS family protein [Rhodospirillales bacterium]